MLPALSKQTVLAFFLFSFLFYHRSISFFLFCITVLLTYFLEALSRGGLNHPYISCTEQLNSRPLGLRVKEMVVKQQDHSMWLSFSGALPPRSPPRTYTIWCGWKWREIFPLPSSCTILLLNIFPVSGVNGVVMTSSVMIASLRQARRSV